MKIITYHSYFFINNSFNEIVENIPDKNFNSIDLKNVFCEKNYCELYDNKNYFFYDQSHHSYFGAKKIISYLMKENYFSY